MRFSRCASTLGIVLTAASLTSQAVHPDELALKPKIDAAIIAGIDSLLDSQLRDGSWGVEHGHVGGQAGLCAYALIKCGVRLDHPGLRRAFAYLDSVRPTNTHAIACMMLAYGASGDPQHLSRLRRLLVVLLGCQNRAGTWAYPAKRPDLSNTQYAALGLWAADKAGLKVPSKAWNDLIDGVLKYQAAPRLMKVVDDGIKGRTSTGTAKRELAGFSYHVKKGNKGITGTMTTAGISVLKICEIGLGKKLRSSKRRRIERGIAAGMAWLEVNFSVSSDQKPKAKGGKWLLYSLYGMERVGGLTRTEQWTHL